MKNRWARFFMFSVLVVFTAAGCATAKPRNTDAYAAPAGDPQVTALQTELQAKDQQIQDLQYQLEQSRQGSSSSYANTVSSGTSSKIRVSGVTVADVQRALTKAGFDPGTVDGRLGKKTKAAIKAFQRAHGLKADGVVGDRTWKLLQV